MSSQPVRVPPAIQALPRGERVREFNDTLIRLLDNLRPYLGPMAEYEQVRSGAVMLANAQPQRNVQLFDANIARTYGARIVSRDEAFFLEDASYTEVGAGGSGVITMLKSVWRNVPSGDREVVWDCLHAMVVLAASCR